LPTLEEAAGLLADVPPEAFMDGPPDGADLLIRRTVRAIRALEGGAAPATAPATRIPRHGRPRTGCPAGRG
jgi:hypothetical protein